MRDYLYWKRRCPSTERQIVWFSCTHHTNFKQGSLSLKFIINGDTTECLLNCQFLKCALATLKNMPILLKNARRASRDVLFTDERNFKSETPLLVCRPFALCRSWSDPVATGCLYETVQSTACVASEQPQWLKFEPMQVAPCNYFKQGSVSKLKFTQPRCMTAMSSHCPPGNVTRRCEIRIAGPETFSGIGERLHNPGTLKPGDFHPVKCGDHVVLS